MLALFLCIAGFCALIWRLYRMPRDRLTALIAAAGVFTFLFLTTAWLIANAFTGEGFNGAVIYHLRAGFGGAGLGEYAGLIVLFMALVAAALFVSRIAYRRLTMTGSDSNGASGTSLVAGLWVLCLIHPTINGTLRVFNHAIYGPDSFADRAIEGGITGEPFAKYYVPPVPTPVSDLRHNLLVIYAESLEKTYFDEGRFPGLITELRELQGQAVVFDDIRQVEGTGFTIAGIVASQCGLPLITTGHPNSMRGMDRFMSGATCLGDLLADAGYALHYLGGADLAFAGKGTFLKSHGYASIEGLSELGPRLTDHDYLSTWGLYDDSLFEFVTERLDDLNGSEEPFGLVTLTMDTHHPHGHQSRSCEGFEYGDGQNRMLNAVRCSDHLIAQMLRRVLASPQADNTLVVLASDHLALKNDAYDLLTSGPRKNLLWLFPPGGEAAVINTPGTTMDTAAIVSHYLGLGTTDFGLGRNLIAGTKSLMNTVPRINWQLREWRGDYAALWELPDAIRALHLDPVERTVTINDRVFAAPALISLNNGKLDTLRFAFDSKRIELYQYLLKEDDATPFVWVDECRFVRSMDTSLPRRGLCFYAGKLEGRDSLAGALDQRTTIDPKTLESVSYSFPSKRRLEERTTRLDNLEEFGVADLQRFELVSNSLHAGAELRVSSSGGPGSRSALASESDRAPLRRGVQLFSVDVNGALGLLAHFDPCTDDTSADSIGARALRNHTDGNPDKPYLVVVHDSATCGTSLEPLFRDLPVEQGRELAFREPYIALLAPGLKSSVFEARGGRNSEIRAVLRGPDVIKVAEMAQNN